MIAWRFIAFAFCWLQLTSVTASAAQLPVILVVGDSLSAEYGLRRDSGWVALLDQRLREKNKKYLLQNASVSGDTTSGGLSRLPAALAAQQPAIVIIELGSNDALRGLALSMTKNNLDAMIQLSQQAGAQVLLLGMQIPPNYGRRYTEQFRLSFHQLAADRQTKLVPFLLEGIAQDPSLFQADGIHPNETAQNTIANNVWAELQPMLD